MSARETVESFYLAVGAGDADAIATIVDGSFTTDVVLSLPRSLPYGGEISGAHRLRRMFVGGASAATPVGPSGVRLTELTDGGSAIAAEVVFDYYPPGGGDPVPSGACEIWTFDSAGGVVAIRGYYRDTAELAGH
ncbi:hypothetical protein Ae168Ps1_1840c [Pseudonocardia sp. Ae168_Ps1]|uniref:nuclear transport factor 2 family protein n=1 Tax=unclassified Pseudonocardia TaxID=2619320 RepID=UPI00094AD888|nr:MULTISPECIES: nuclear transport factor 2 family protein [unclassified Pseudonocardia]OLL73458.1 hypothetical protein Ae150APs1_1836c [Pseudonocardia sp. Ae150A_Ps1]OLL79434.1 hypothetical protein Ae168Ps1_1840c [Pseudonocardia sp. Ae168_Ps1]OLL86431.1 hypothetical protein Ae263Ps1_3486 [Pseudonocardia sp. Ae263_Ps1]OLL93528.1 hypothetical protein Ae356Ps1_3425c [Pseudonocardia sp. Ae356_Ps1]